MERLSLSAAVFAAAGLICCAPMAQSASITVDFVKSFDIGGAIAFDGTTAVFGNVGDSTNGLQAGAVTTLDIVTGTQTKLLASDGAARDFLGTSVAISGTTVLGGATGADTAASSSGTGFGGAAYVFETAGMGGQTKVVRNGAANGDEFGRVVALDGTTALIGAPGFGRREGVATLFDTTTGVQTTLLPNDRTDFATFGKQVALEGTTALIGNASGEVYVFDTTTGSQTAKLTSADTSGGDALGGGIAVSGTTALIGGGGETAYLFDLSTPTPTELFRLTASDSFDFNTVDFLGAGPFGGAVAIDGGIAVLGAAGHANGGDPFDNPFGAAYVFDTVTGTLITKLSDPTMSGSGGFGRGVAISGDNILVESDGQTHLFEINRHDMSGGGGGPATVPLPPALTLLLGGIGGMVLVGWRRRLRD